MCPASLLQECYFSRLVPIVIGRVPVITERQGQTEPDPLVAMMAAAVAITHPVAVAIPVWIAIIETVTGITIPVPVMTIPIVMTVVVLPGIGMVVMVVPVAVMAFGIMSAAIVPGIRRCLQGQGNTSYEEHCNQCKSVNIYFAHLHLLYLFMA